jgi:hypothetical protein
MGMYPNTRSNRCEHPHEIEAFRRKYAGCYGEFGLKGFHPFRGIKETITRQQHTCLEARQGFQI